MRADSSNSNAFRLLLAAAVTVGVLDGLDAVTFFGLRGVSATRIFQYIASSVLGHDAFTMGNASVLVGVVLHFSVAFVLSAAWLGLRRLFPSLGVRWFAEGVAYGLVTYAVMNYLVLGLTRLPPQAIPALPVLLNGVLAHVFLVGVPIAMIFRRRQDAPGGA